METLAYVHYASGLPGRALDFDGELTLRQTWPLTVRGWRDRAWPPVRPVGLMWWCVIMHGSTWQVVGGYKSLYSDEPLLDAESSTLAARDLVPSTILRRYRSRNVTTHVQGEYVWSRQAAQAYDASASRPVFNLTASLRYPVTRVSYTPEVAEVLKSAWMQYLAMLVVVAFLLDRLCSFVCYHQVRRQAPQQRAGRHTCSHAQ